MPLRCLADFHHTDLYRGFQMLFEQRLGYELYRPCGPEWYPRFYWHPIEGEALGNLMPYAQFDPAIHKSVLPEKEEQSEGVLWKNFRNGLNDGVLFRWMTLDQAKDLDLIVCTIARNESRFHDLKNYLGLKCPIVRYTGNTMESLNLDHFDIFLPAYYPDYEQYVKTGKKPGILYHPEFDETLYNYTPVTQNYEGPNGEVWNHAILRGFLNFMWHHRESGGMFEYWNRYAGYGSEVGAKAFMHGVGTPPEGLDLEINMPMDLALEKVGRLDLQDRSKWPDLRWHRGEAPNHPVLAGLMKMCNMVIHPKWLAEGYGFVIHQLASVGRPAIVPRHYETLSAKLFMQHRETCIFMSGDESTCKTDLHWALEPENNARMSETLHKRFKENVNFEDEAARIEALL